MIEIPRIRAALLAFTTLLSLYFGFFAFTPDEGAEFLRFKGYWLLMFACAVFTVSLLLTLAGLVKENCLDRRDAIAVFAVFVAWSLLGSQESFGFKVVNDEISQAASSLQIHSLGELHTPLRGYSIDGAYYISGSFLDKRPYLFPFVVSIAHDFTGYRPENAFFVNFALSYVLMGALYMLGRILGGIRGGLLAAFLVASVPQLIRTAHGSGFELLNLLMIVLCILVGFHYWRTSSPRAFVALCFSGMLLTQLRYESIIFVVPVAALALWRWWSQRKVEIPWMLLAVPLLVAMYPLQYRFFAQRPDWWQLADRPAASSAFGFQYLFDNIGHAAFFFFDPSMRQPNSLAVSVFGFVALAALAVVLVKPDMRRRALGKDGVSIAVFGAALSVLTLLLFCYFYSEFDNPMMRRLTLPIHLLLVFPGVLLLGRVFKSGRLWMLVFALCFSGIALQTVPTLRAEYVERSNLAARAANWKSQFIREQAGHYVLGIDHASIIPVMYRQAGLPFFRIPERRDALKFHFEAGTFDEVYVFQALRPDHTGRLVTYPGFETPEGFVLEEITRKEFEPAMTWRISRLTAIEGSRDPLREFWQEAARLESDAERQAAFKRRWYEMLP